MNQVDYNIREETDERWYEGYRGGIALLGVMWGMIIAGAIYNSGLRDSTEEIIGETRDAEIVESVDLERGGI